MFAKGLDLDHQWYLFENIREFCRIDEPKTWHVRNALLVSNKKQTVPPKKEDALRCASDLLWWCHNNYIHHVSVFILAKVLGDIFSHKQCKKSSIPRKAKTCIRLLNVSVDTGFEMFNANVCCSNCTSLFSSFLYLIFTKQKSFFPCRSNHAIVFTLWTQTAYQKNWKKISVNIVFIYVLQWKSYIFVCLLHCFHSNKNKQFLCLSYCLFCLFFSIRNNDK